MERRNRPTKLSIYLMWVVGLSALTHTTSLSAAEHRISTTTGTFDCDANNVHPGDTVVIEGPTRGELHLSNCYGSNERPITIRNDIFADAPLTISVNGSQYFRGIDCNNCVNVVIDGTKKWVGASQDGCGMALSWPEVPARPQCGIKIECAGSSPTAFVTFRGSSRNFTLKGVEIDGKYPQCTEATQGILVNDHSYDRSDHPGEWRENIVLSDNYIHDVSRSGVYFGPNYDEGGVVNDDLPLRNNEVSHNLIVDVGCDGIKMKFALEGTSTIHHNWVNGTGTLSGADNSSGCTGVGIAIADGGYTDIHSNIVQRTGVVGDKLGYGIFGYLDIPDSVLKDAPIDVFNNVVFDTRSSGIVFFREESSTAGTTPSIYNNTIVDVGGPSIQISPNLASFKPLVRDNIIAGNGSDIAVPSSTLVENNRHGTVEELKFFDASGKIFRLTSESPAVDAGTASGPSTDVTGKPRTSPFDQGAWEWLPEGPMPPEKVEAL